MNIKLKKKNTSINKSFRLPGDKSIAHRSLIIGALGEGNYEISNFPRSQDCLSTVDCMIKLGVKAEEKDDKIYVSSPGYRGFNKVSGLLNANNSGTTARLLSGLVSGCGIECTIDGDSSLRKRPMDRVVVPLQRMGAKIKCEDSLLPLNFKNNSGLSCIDYLMPVSSAQVKSCVLIAGFLANGETRVTEKESTRDHTERMLKAIGADISVNDKLISIKNSQVSVKDIFIPGDISSAAFLIACTLLSENAEVTIKDVLLNERRRSYLDMLKKMGAQLEYKINSISNGEEIGHIYAKSSRLNGIIISEEEVPNIIDEVPMLSVLAAFSSGNTVIRGIKELKYKESNRIKAIAENLILSGIKVSHTEDYIEIIGDNSFINGIISIKPYNDHRIALAFMALAVRNLGETFIENWECTDISFPNALEYFKEFFDISIH
jgi:3-phosphoshikimate 1-carboxyvinyltransferase